MGTEMTEDDSLMPKWDVALEALLAEEFEERGVEMRIADFQRLARGRTTIGCSSGGAPGKRIWRSTTAAGSSSCRPPEPIPSPSIASSGQPFPVAAQKVVDGLQPDLDGTGGAVFVQIPEGEEGGAALFDDLLDQVVDGRIVAALEAGELQADE